MSEEEGKKDVIEEVANEGDDNEDYEYEEYEEVEENIPEEAKELNEEGKRMVELKKVGERKQSSKHEVTSQELTAGKKVIEALEKRRQAQNHEEELLKKIKDEDVVLLPGETIESAKDRMVQEMIEKERKGSVFEDKDRAKDKKLISNMFDVDTAPYDTLFDIQWGMRSNTAAIREPRGYVIDGVFPFLIDKENEEEDEAQYGVFCHGNTYIYLAPGKSAETFNIFCWYGNKCSFDKRGVCAMLASQLSVCLDNHAKIYYEEDGNESSLFKEMFVETDGITYTDEGLTDSLLHPPKKEKRKLKLFKIDEVYKNLTRVEQVEPNHTSLTPYDAFVFDDNKRVYVFSTKYASNRVRNRALQFAMVLRSQNNYEESEVFMEPSPKMLLLYRALKLDDMSYDELCEYILRESQPNKSKPSFGMLMRFTHNTKTSQIVKTIKPDNIPLTKKMLRSHRCYIYDCGNEIYMWKGTKCSRKEWELLKLLANKVILKMIDRPKWTKIQDEFEGKETEAFKYHVADWDYSTIIVTENDYEKHINLLSKRIDYNALVIKEINEAKKEFEKIKEEEKGRNEQQQSNENDSSIKFKENIQKKIQLLVGKKQPIIYDYKWDIDTYKLKIQTMVEKKWEPTVLTQETIDYELKYNITETLKLTDIQIYAFVDIEGPSIYRVPEEKYGEFYDYNSYIVSVEKWDFTKDIWKRDFYFWEGKNSNPLYYSQFLKKNYPVLTEYYQKNKSRKDNEMNARQASENRIVFSQSRVFQGCEPKPFSELFNFRIIVKKGNYKNSIVVREDNTNYDDEDDQDYVYEDDEVDGEGDEEVEYYDEEGNLIQPGEDEDEEWEYEDGDDENKEENEEENDNILKEEQPEEEIEEENQPEEEENKKETKEEVKEENKVLNRFFEISMEDRTQRIYELNLEEETVGRYIESHRCYALQTPYCVYLWVGKQTDQISRIQAIRTSITLLEEDREFVCFEEGFHYNEFWDILHGIEKGYLSLNPKDLALAAPLVYEITPCSQNYIGIGLNWKKADASSCYLFDCMSRIYVWMGDESIPLQQKYAIKVAYDYSEERMKERNNQIEIMMECCGSESEHFLRMCGGERMEYNNKTKDPREQYYKTKKESWIELPEIGENEIGENEIKINWDKVNEEEFENKMRESRNKGIESLKEKEKMKEKGNEILRNEWKNNKELNDFIKTFKDEDTDIESLPDEDLECKEMSTKQLMEDIRKDEQKEKQENDEIDRMIEEELKEKFGDNIEYIEEEEEEEWEEGEWEYEYEDAGEYEQGEEEGDDEYEYEEEEESEEYASGEEDDDLLESKKNAAESKEKTIEDLRKEEIKKDELEKKLRNKNVDKKNAYLNEVIACDYCYEEHPRYLLRKNIGADDMENGICWECWKIYFPDEKWPELKQEFH